MHQNGMMVISNCIDPSRWMNDGEESKGVEVLRRLARE
jgi:hypothetical protein